MSEPTPIEMIYPQLAQDMIQDGVYDEDADYLEIGLDRLLQVAQDDDTR